MNKPLVSIIVVSYNSAGFILETLESIKVQSYKNIELIISDDCSKDNTVSLCQDWLKGNGRYFTRSEIITTDVNTGISANCNRGVRKAKGDWIKILAADDLLLPDAIENNMDFIRKHKKAQIIFSKIIAFGDDPEFVSRHEKVFIYDFFKLPRRLFFMALLDENFIPASTGVIRKDVFQKIGLFDESIPMLEDWPFWIEACKAKIRIVFLDRRTVKYRIHHNSTSNGQLSERYQESLHRLSEKCSDTIKQHFKLLWLRRVCIEYRNRANRIFKHFYNFLITINPDNHRLERIRCIRAEKLK